MPRTAWLAWPALAVLLVPVAWAVAGQGDAEPAEAGSLWFWPAVLFVVSLAIGIVAPLGGVGGAVLYVPLVSSFMPFHLDYVRCSGLLVAVAGSIVAGPGLLRRGLASLRLTMPMAMIASASAIVGAKLGLLLPANIVQTAMGAMILGIAALMALVRRSEHAAPARSDALSEALGIYGIYNERTSGRTVEWRIHRTAIGMVLFVGVGLLGGMFGVGAGWANVPVLNLLLGAPLRLSVATSHFMIAITGTTASWVYLHSGAALPLIVIPSIAGSMAGSLLGARLLPRVKPRGIRLVVLGLLAFAGGRVMLKGLGIWN